MVTIECLHFKSGLDITQAVNMSTGQVELQIEGRSTIAGITGLQNEVDKITNLIPNAPRTRRVLNFVLHRAGHGRARSPVWTNAPQQSQEGGTHHAD